MTCRVGRRALLASASSSTPGSLLLVTVSRVPAVAFAMTPAAPVLKESTLSRITGWLALRDVSDQWAKPFVTMSIASSLVSSNGSAEPDLWEALQDLLLGLRPYGAPEVGVRGRIDRTALRVAQNPCDAPEPS